MQPSFKAFMNYGNPREEIHGVCRQPGIAGTNGPKVKSGHYQCRYQKYQKDKVAYQYLSDSAASFPYGEAFNNILQKIGFIAIEDKPQTLGVASIYIAKK